MVLRGRCQHVRCGGTCIGRRVPQYGGTLTYMIPAESPPSFDAQREEAFATIHSAAPFYSTLIRDQSYNPNSATNIVCDLCTDMPEPSAAATTSYFREDIARC